MAKYELDCIFLPIDKVIGVAQLCNKLNGNSFTKFDEERTTAFAIFVGLSLVQVMVLFLHLEMLCKQKTERYFLSRM